MASCAFAKIVNPLLSLLDVSLNDIPFKLNHPQRGVC